MNLGVIKIKSEKNNYEIDLENVKYKYINGINNHY